MRHQQRGITFLGLIFVGAVFGSLILVGMRVFPTTVEFMAIQKAVKKASAGNTVAEVRTIFDKAAQIDDISSIKGADLEVTKSGDQVVVNFAYQREMHLAGPAYLLLKYQGSSR
jgi:beta-lactam-binding protein with PASTA domain